MLFVGVSYLGFAQAIGGNATPLYSSTHKYTVDMSDAGNNFSWSVYAGHITSAQIDAGTVTPLPATGYYKFGEIDVDGTGKAYVNITFDGDLANLPYLGYSGSNGQYTIVYNEATTGTYVCDRSIVYHLVLQPPIDIDVDLAIVSANKCPDQSNTPQEGTSSQTSRDYKVSLVFPATNPGYVSTWNFTMDVEIKGKSGANASIHSVSVGATTIATSINQSTYSFNYDVTTVGIRDVTVTVVFNDQLGVEQDVIVELPYISAFYDERDHDEIFKTTGNIVTDVIWAMPDVGAITAWGP